MVDFHDPVKVSRDFLAVVKLWHTLDGLYIWEFVTTLDYEWNVFRGRQRYLWTIWVYSLTRVATLLAVIVNMIGFDVTRAINCQVWVTSELAFAYFAFASASLLIVLRTIAIWNRNWIILMTAGGLWLANVSFLIRMVELRSSWSPTQGTCNVLNTQSSKACILSYLISDTIFLFMMLVGLFRLHLEGSLRGLARLLWKQGIIWLLLGILAEVPPTVFVFLNLNEPFNLMFQTPSLITMSIAATRMYRGLTKYGSSDIFHNAPQSRTASWAKPIAGEPNRFNQVGHSEEDPGSYSSTDRQRYDKPQGFAIDGYVKSEEG